MADLATFDRTGADRLASAVIAKDMGTAVTRELAVFLRDALALLSQAQIAHENVRARVLRAEHDAANLTAEFTACQALRKAHQREYKARVANYEGALMTIAAVHAPWWKRWGVRPLVQVAQQALAAGLGP